MKIDEYLNLEPFSLNKKKKGKLFSILINDLTKYHYKHCYEYKKFLNFFGYNGKKNIVSKIPFLPTSLFKKFNFSSVPKKKVFKTITSSGTSGFPSKIYLDKITL